MQTEPRHSGLGIASFAISLLAALLLLCTLVAGGVLEATTPGGMDEHAVSTILVGLAAIVVMLMAVLASGLGIASMLQRTRRKVFGVLGLVFSVSMVLLVVGLMVLGSLKQAG